MCFWPASCDVTKGAATPLLCVTASHPLHLCNLGLLSPAASFTSPATATHPPFYSLLTRCGTSPLSADQMDTQRPLRHPANPSLDLSCLRGLFREISLADFYARQPRELDPWTKFIKGKALCLLPPPKPPSQIHHPVPPTHQSQGPLVFV